MTKDEALKLALEALKYPINQSHENFNVDMAELLAHRAITAIEEALAQPEQEPVAWVYDPITGSITPPQRKPLTDEEIKAMYIEKNWYEMAHAFTWGAAEVVARAIEAAHGIGE